MLSSYTVIFFDLGETLVTSGRSWIPEAENLLTGLQAAGARLGIISNTADLTRDQVLQLLPPDFDFDVFEPELVLLSSEVGVEKPSLEIFQLAVRRAGVTATECLFCTEALLDTLAAQRVQMHTARLQPPPQGEIAGLIEALEKLDAML